MVELDIEMNPIKPCGWLKDDRIRIEFMIYESLIYVLPKVRTFEKKKKHPKKTKQQPINTWK